jgi:hypothetical protein
MRWIGVASAIENRATGRDGREDIQERQVRAGNGFSPFIYRTERKRR